MPILPSLVTQSFSLLVYLAHNLDSKVECFFSNFADKNIWPSLGIDGKIYAMFKYLLFIIFFLSCSTKLDKNSSTHVIVEHEFSHNQECLNDKKKLWKKIELNGVSLPIKCFKGDHMDGFFIPYQFTDSASELTIAQNAGDEGESWTISAALFKYNSQYILQVKNLLNYDSGCSFSQSFYRWNSMKKIFEESTYQGPLPDYSQVELGYLKQCKNVP